MKQRVIRVFISSTFRDMGAERDHLVKFVFPQLRHLCDCRGVVWGEVDLRWGVTEEQKAEGQVLPICLKEIRNCRPYFIGLLGERYGWIPDVISEELLRNEPWLGEHRDHSVTELEILHGVLNDPEMADHAYFYFRDPAYIQQLSPNVRGDYISEDPDSANKLETLKDRIRKSLFPVRENYLDVKALGDLVLQDMTAVINQLFPDGSQPDPLDREAMEHESYAQSRARVYIGRQEYFDRLDSHAMGDSEHPLVILGDSGSGKSALLANWAIRYRQEYPTDLVIQHYIGATADSSDWVALIHRIMMELGRHCGFTTDIPAKLDKLKIAFASCLNMAASHGRVILVLDALNQLEDRDNAPDLDWLPPSIPSNIRLIVSTLAGRSCNVIRRRRWPALNVQNFTIDERREFIQRYLAQYSKSLSPDLLERVAASEQTGVPLYLQALLEELRVFGSHELLQTQLCYYLDAGTLPGLYDKILARYENDYDHDYPGLVASTMSSLGVARRGLSDAELLYIVGDDNGPAPHAAWSPLFLSAQQSFNNRTGLISFSHDHFRQAVYLRYLKEPESEYRARLRIASYFDTCDLSARKIEELPWQLVNTQSWERLHQVYSDVMFLAAAWRANSYDVRKFWTLLEANSGFRITDTYAEALGHGVGSRAAELECLAEFLQALGHPVEAERIWQHVVAHYRLVDDQNNLARALGSYASVLLEMGSLDRAMDMALEQQSLCEKSADLRGCASSLGVQAQVLVGRDDYQRAFDLLNEQRKLCLELSDSCALSQCVEMQARALLEKPGEAEAHVLRGVLREYEQHCRKTGDLRGLANCLGMQAESQQGTGGTILELITEQEKICREIGDQWGLAAVWGTRARIDVANEDFAAAIRNLGKQRQLFYQLGAEIELADNLAKLANAYYWGGTFLQHCKSNFLHRKARAELTRKGLVSNLRKIEQDTPSSFLFLGVFAFGSFIFCVMILPSLFSMHRPPTWITIFWVCFLLCFIIVDIIPWAFFRIRRRFFFSRPVAESSQVNGEANKSKSDAQNQQEVQEPLSLGVSDGSEDALTAETFDSPNQGGGRSTTWRFGRFKYLKWSQTLYARKEKLEMAIIMAIVRFLPAFVAIANVLFPICAFSSGLGTLVTGVVRKSRAMIQRTGFIFMNPLNRPLLDESRRVRSLIAQGKGEEALALLEDELGCLNLFHRMRHLKYLHEVSIAEIEDNTTVISQYVQETFTKEHAFAETGMRLLKCQEAIGRVLSNPDIIQESLGLQADILRVMGGNVEQENTKQALMLYRKQEQCLRDLGKVYMLGYCRGCQGIAFRELKKPVEARECFRQMRSLSIQLEAKPMVAYALNEIASTYGDEGAHEEELHFQQQEEQILRELSNVRDLSVCLKEQARTLDELGRLQEAEQRRKEAESLLTAAHNRDESGDQNGSSGADIGRIGGVYTYLKQASEAKRQGDFAAAENALEQALSICLQMSESGLTEITPQTMRILVELAKLAQTQSRYAEAERLYGTALRMIAVFNGSKEWSMSMLFWGMGRLYSEWAEAVDESTLEGLEKLAIASASYARSQNSGNHSLSVALWTLAARLAAILRHPWGSIPLAYLFWTVLGVAAYLMFVMVGLVKPFTAPLGLFVSCGCIGSLLATRHAVLHHPRIAPLRKRLLGSVGLAIAGWCMLFLLLPYVVTLILGSADEGLKAIQMHWRTVARDFMFITCCASISGVINWYRYRNR